RHNGPGELEAELLLQTGGAAPAEHSCLRDTKSRLLRTAFPLGHALELRARGSGVQFGPSFAPAPPIRGTVECPPLWPIPSLLAAGKRSPFSVILHPALTGC